MVERVADFGFAPAIHQAPWNGPRQTGPILDEQAEQRARKSQRGLWIDYHLLRPWQWLRRQVRVRNTRIAVGHASRRDRRFTTQSGQPRSPRERPI